MDIQGTIAAAGNWKTWLNGLVGGTISTVASAVTVMITDPNDYNPWAEGGAGWAKLGTLVTVNMIIGAALWLKSHPTPWSES